MLSSSLCNRPPTRSTSWSSINGCCSNRSDMWPKTFPRIFPVQTSHSEFAWPSTSPLRSTPLCWIASRIYTHPEHCEQNVKSTPSLPRALQAWGIPAPLSPMPLLAQLLNSGAIQVVHTLKTSSFISLVTATSGHREWSSLSQRGSCYQIWLASNVFIVTPLDNMSARFLSPGQNFQFIVPVNFWISTTLFLTSVFQLCR